MSILEREKIKRHLGWFAQVKIGTKNHRKLNKKYRKIIRLSKVARAEIQAFIILSSRTFNFLDAQSVISL